MLRALGEQLKLLAADPKNHFSSRIRSLTGPREAVRYGQPLRRMILAMPRMIAHLRRWSDDSKLPLKSRRMQAFALRYLYEPIDFLGVKEAGLFRFLDDAYLIARIFQMTLAQNTASKLKSGRDDASLVRSVPEWVDLARTLLPKETGKIEALLAEVAAGRRERVVRAYKKARKKKRRQDFTENQDIGGEG